MGLKIYGVELEFNTMKDMKTLFKHRFKPRGFISDVKGITEMFVCLRNCDSVDLCL